MKNYPILVALVAALLFGAAAPLSKRLSTRIRIGRTCIIVMIIRLEVFLRFSASRPSLARLWPLC
jgi:hypothetical protein